MVLQAEKLKRIIDFAAGSDGMGAVVTPGAINPTMTAGLAVEFLILRIDRTMTDLVVTARLIEPGRIVPRNLVHRPVTIDAVDIGRRKRHNIPQALGGGAWVTVVAAIEGIGDFPIMFFMDCVGKVRDTG